jgi:predicted metal-dependent hydrolase
VKHFVGQEASHRHVHVQFNEQLAHQGLVYTLEPKMRRRVALMDKLDLRSRLAITCALEHYTAMLADGLLRYPEWLDDAEPALRTLWSWHAAEETEHKGVAFDVYHAAGGGYLRRVLWFIEISRAFWFDVGCQTLHNLRQDGQLYRARTWISAARTWFGRHGLAWHMLGPSLRYMTPSFHPWQHDNRGLVEAWLDRNSGAYRAVAAPGDAPPVASMAGGGRKVS